MGFINNVVVAKFNILSYEGQLQMKHDTVVNQLKRIGHIENANVLPTIGMENPNRYRNKTQVPFGYENGEVVAGFYQKRSHEITNMKSCLIQNRYFRSNCRYDA